MNRTFVGSTATKSQPAYAIVIDDNAWVKRCRTILQSRHILIYKRLSQRITPTLHWICGCDNTYTLSTICKIQIKMSQAILLNTGSDGWRPGIDNPWCNLPHFDSSMINPVGHIIGRKYHQWTNLIVIIFRILLVLLMIVGSIHVKSSVVLYTSWIRTKDRWRDRIGIGFRFPSISANLINNIPLIKTLQNLSLRSIRQLTGNRCRGIGNHLCCWHKAQSRHYQTKT